jgi:hypothetical protein
MVRKLQILAIVLCMLEYSASAATSSIGTVSVHGNMTVDSYSVNGNATLFNGTVVETDKSSAELRLGKGISLTMGTSSSGKLFSDHMELNRGEAQLNASSSYHVVAQGLQVAPAENASVIVAVLNDNSVEVAAISGTVTVMGVHGAVLANVVPGKPRVFAAMAAGDDNDKDKKGGYWAGGGSHTALILGTEVLIAGIAGGIAASQTSQSPASR